MKKPQYPPVVVVEESDNEIGTAPLSEVWRKGFYHRIVSIYVFDEKSEWVDIHDAINNMHFEQEVYFLNQILSS